MNTDYEKLESNIGYCFKDKDLLINALTHTSYANEHKHKGMKDNERLEFLGDAVLELVSSEYLYKNMKDMPEGKMTKLRASLVCEPTLAMDARGGLWTPLSLPMITWPPTRLAPVLPAETIPSASPFLTIYKHFTSEESVFSLIAATGGSPVSIISVALTISNWSLLYLYFMKVSAEYFYRRLRELLLMVSRINLELYL